MVCRPPICSRTYPLFPFTTLFRSLATAGLVSSLLALAALAMSVRTPVCLPAPEQDVFQPVFTASGGRRRKPVRAFCRTTARNLNHASTTIFAVLPERALRATSLMSRARHAPADPPHKSEERRVGK